MGIKSSKQSVDISTTPKKTGPEGDINGKLVTDEVKVNGESEKSPTNGDLKIEEETKETPKEVKEEEAVETKDEGDKNEDVAETPKDEKKKVSTKEKLKKNFSIRTLNFMRKKPKSKEDADTSKTEGTAGETEAADEAKAEDESKAADESNTTDETKEGAQEAVQQTDDAKLEPEIVDAKVPSEEAEKHDLKTSPAAEASKDDADVATTTTEESSAVAAEE